MCCRSVREPGMATKRIGRSTRTSASSGSKSMLDAKPTRPPLTSVCQIIMRSIACPSAEYEVVTSGDTRFACCPACAAIESHHTRTESRCHSPCCCSSSNPSACSPVAAHGTSINGTSYAHFRHSRAARAVDNGVQAVSALELLFVLPMPRFAQLEAADENQSACKCVMRTLVASRRWLTISSTVLLWA